MAGRNRKNPFPRCTATLKDGSTCTTFAVGDGLCGYHLRKRDEEAAMEALDESLPAPDVSDLLDEGDASTDSVESQSPLSAWAT
jgi:hypothetical protein